jgi:hypothetical protein
MTDFILLRQAEDARHPARERAVSDLPSQLGAELLVQRCGQVRIEHVDSQAESYRSFALVPGPDGEMVAVDTGAWVSAADEELADDHARGPREYGMNIVAPMADYPDFVIIGEPHGNGYKAYQRGERSRAVGPAINRLTPDELARYEPRPEADRRRVGPAREGCNLPREDRPEATGVLAAAQDRPLLKIINCGCYGLVTAGLPCGLPKA